MTIDATEFEATLQNAKSTEKGNGIATIGPITETITFLNSTAEPVRRKKERRFFRRFLSDPRAERNG